MVAAAGLPRLFERAPIAALVTDAGGLVEYINPQFTKLTGYLLDDIAGEPYLRFARPSEEQQEEAWRNLVAGKPWRGVGYGERQDGTTFRAFVAVSPVTDDSGETTQYLALCVNRSPREAATDAPPATPPRLGNGAGLTAREQEVLSLVARGLTDSEIAERLSISVRTASHHVSVIIGKLGASNRTGAVALAYNLNLRNI